MLIREFMFIGLCLLITCVMAIPETNKGGFAKVMRQRGRGGQIPRPLPGGGHLVTDLNLPDGYQSLMRGGTRVVKGRGIPVRCGKRLIKGRGTKVRGVAMRKGHGMHESPDQQRRTRGASDLFEPRPVMGVRKGPTGADMVKFQRPTQPNPKRGASHSDRSPLKLPHAPIGSGLPSLPPSPDSPQGK